MYGFSEFVLLIIMVKLVYYSWIIDEGQIDRYYLFLDLIFWRQYLNGVMMFSFQ